MENILQRNPRTDRASECIFKLSGGKNFENFSAQHQPRWCLHGFDVCTGLPKKLWIHQWLVLSSSSNSDCGSYITSVAKTASKKIGALICSMKFLSFMRLLSIYKSIIKPCMEHCCHVWAGAPSCYLELLDKIQKRICRTVGPSLAACHEPSAHCQNVASLSFFYRYYFGWCSSKLAWLVELPYSAREVYLLFW